jgi:hypothetical protein
MLFLIFNLLLIKVFTAEFTNSVDVYGDNTFLFVWTINTETQTISIDISARTNGWAGIALSSGGLNGSDVMLGYIDQAGEPHVNDYFINNNVISLDTQLGGQNDLSDFFGSGMKGFTHLHIERKLDTGDKFDKAIIQGEIVKIIFLLGDKPSSENEVVFPTKTLEKEVLLYPTNISEDN